MSNKVTIDGTGTPRARCVLAPNPSPMTLEGTNTWVLGEPGAATAVAVDPGPHDEAHLQRVVATARQTGRRITLTLLTHGHPDHAAGARRFAELTRAPVRALDPAHRCGGEGLGEGDVLEVDGLEIRVLATPGHSADSLCFWLPADSALLTGDTVLGRGTTFIAPDGDVGDYLSSLDRLRRLVAEYEASVLLPGHGPVVEDPAGVLEYYVVHRRERLEQINAALVAGASTPAEIVAMVYADVDRSLWPAAEASVRSQLAYLRSRGASD